MDLSILCISKIEPFSLQFIGSMRDLAYRLGAEMVIAADGDDAVIRAEETFGTKVQIFPVLSEGYLESVHDIAVSVCTGDCVLRLDDDEQCSSAMINWLTAEKYKAYDHWKFPRAAMWHGGMYLRSPQLWPDHQTRLSVKSKALGRTTLHAGSPHGGGFCAPVAIEHYKFVVKTFTQRMRIAENYDRIWAGSGTNGMLAFSLPELAYGDNLPTAVWGDGTVDYR
jgi:hypothetical protein